MKRWVPWGSCSEGNKIRWRGHWYTIVDATERLRQLSQYRGVLGWFQRCWQGYFSLRKILRRHWFSCAENLLQQDPEWFSLMQSQQSPDNSKKNKTVPVHGVKGFFLRLFYRWLPFQWKWHWLQRACLQNISEKEQSVIKSWSADWVTDLKKIFLDSDLAASQEKLSAFLSRTAFSPFFSAAFGEDSNLQEAIADPNSLNLEHYASLSVIWRRVFMEALIQRLGPDMRGLLDDSSLDEWYQCCGNLERQTWRALEWLSVFHPEDEERIHSFLSSPESLGVSAGHDFRFHKKVFSWLARLLMAHQHLFNFNVTEYPIKERYDARRRTLQAHLNDVLLQIAASCWEENEQHEVSDKKYEETLNKMIKLGDRLFAYLGMACYLKQKMLPAVFREEIQEKGAAGCYAQSVNQFWLKKGVIKESWIFLQDQMRHGRWLLRVLESENATISDFEDRSSKVGRLSQSLQDKLSAAETDYADAISQTKSSLMTNQGYLDAISEGAGLRQYAHDVMEGRIEPVPALQRRIEYPDSAVNRYDDDVPYSPLSLWLVPMVETVVSYPDHEPLAKWPRFFAAQSAELASGANGPDSSDESAGESEVIDSASLGAS